MIVNVNNFINFDLEMSVLYRMEFIRACGTLHSRLNTYVFKSLTPSSSPLRVTLVNSLHSTEKFPRKEVIQPHLPVRLPCYDFTPVTNPALGRCLLTVSSRTSGVVDFHGVTGGVYKTRERIQRSVLICVY